eukprot:TRINITY_DN2529_c1_g1_i2.p1 TRINITY_DN2529_c1_g1~~TRINITY_DN2529_c1_g1_i2.p1  ORF type:complete len:220 (+),score=44.86 TRINITY_DN2529_c1_g1_i2:94-753(+)
MNKHRAAAAAPLTRPASDLSKSSDFAFKVLIVGESGVGKSALLLRFADGNYTDQFYSTVGVDFKCKGIAVDDRFCSLKIWDTAGQERYRNITSGYYRGAHGILLCFDLTDSYSFQRVKNWVTDIKRFSGDNVPATLVGLKGDLTSKRVIDRDEAAQLAKSLGMDYLEASSKTGQGVDETFDALTRMMIRVHGKSMSQRKEGVPIGKTPKKSLFSMCTIL